MTNYTTRKLAVLLLLLCTAIIFSLPNQLIALVKWSRDGSFTHRTGSAKEKSSFPEHGDENCKMVLAQNGPDENLNEDEISAMVDPKCEVPSLQKGEVHVIIAGYEGLNDRKGFSDNESYLFDIGLTNADNFWYRRLDAQKPLRHIEGPCGQSFHERLLLPNHGRDASGLYDYIVEFYHNLPDILIFMHGHGAHSYHTNCEAIFARTVYYYRAYVNKNILRCKGKSVLGHRMTLTSRSTTTIDYSHNWYGVDHSRRLNRHNRCREYINAKWGDLFEYKGGDKSRSCCASFIMTSERITRYPLEFWEDMLHLVRDPKTNDGIFSRICFEFILAFLFYDDVDFTFDEVSVFYNEADSLIHGKLRDANSTGPDRGLVERMGKCNMEQ